jgi:hypothetical protein
MERGDGAWAGLRLLAAVGVVAVATGASGAAQDADVHMNNGFAAAAVRSAISGAKRRLAREGCRDLLREFKDAEGHTLQANLEARHRTAEAQLQALQFEDGVSRRLCDKNGIHAVTRPGSSLVYICSDAFLTAYRRNPYLAESYIIHEMLHTLGLGENPPSSQQITDRVVEACHN